MKLETLILLGGLGHLGILTAGPFMTKTLRWKTELKTIDPLSEHVIWTHALFVWFVILAFALVSIFFPAALVESQPLGRVVCAFIAFFWGVRLVIQFFYFDATPHLKDWKLKIGFHGLTVCFLFFTLVYGYASIRNAFR